MIYRRLKKFYVNGGPEGDYWEDYDVENGVATPAATNRYNPNIPSVRDLPVKTIGPQGQPTTSVAGTAGGLAKGMSKGMGSSVPYAQLGQFAGDTVDTLSPPDKYGVKSDGAAIGGGALKGAGTGAALGSVVPGVGTAVGAVAGAVIGGIGGALGNDKAKKERTKAIERYNYQVNQTAARPYIGYDTEGSNQHQIYAEYGGAVKPTIYLDGGELKPMSRDSVEIEGNSHEEGGVQLGPQTEVEGDETMKGNFVYSDSLPANGKGQSFADVHKGLAKTKGKLQEKYKSPVVNNTLALLDRKEEALKLQQETLKNMLGIKPIVR